jgi:hypothetical protein
VQERQITAASNKHSSKKAAMQLSNTFSTAGSFIVLGFCV